jgi:hypothetical protein
MRCYKCGTEIETENGSCPNCGERLDGSEVEVLPPEERDEFQGITIEQNPQTSGERGYYEYHDPHKGVYVRQINLSGKGGWLSRILVGLIIFALIFFIFPFLLVLLIFFVPVILVWLFFFFGRRR